MGRGPSRSPPTTPPETAVILFDTQVLIWLNRSPEKLSRDARRAIARATSAGAAAIASITLWELATLVLRGRIRLKAGTVRTFLEEMVQTPGLTVLEITAEVAVLAAQFPSDFPADPADRLIAATARAHRSPLVTSDERIQKSPLVQTIW
jgi:PIN domain nuclease of toxin-antitoxin system